MRNSVQQIRGNRSPYSSHSGTDVVQGGTCFTQVGLGLWFGRVEPGTHVSLCERGFAGSMNDLADPCDTFRSIHHKGKEHADTHSRKHLAYANTRLHDYEVDYGE